MFVFNFDHYFVGYQKFYKKKKQKKNRLGSKINYDNVDSRNQTNIILSLTFRFKSERKTDVKKFAFSFACPYNHNIFQKKN